MLLVGCLTSQQHASESQGRRWWVGGGNFDGSGGDDSGGSVGILTALLSTPSSRSSSRSDTGGKGDPLSLAPPGCLLLEQGEFVPWDNPDNIISREVSCLLDR